MPGQVILYAFAVLFVLAVIGIVLVPVVLSVLDKLSFVEFKMTGNTLVAELHDSFTSIIHYFPLAAGGAVFLGLLLWAIRRVIWGGTRDEGWVEEPAE